MGGVATSFAARAGLRSWLSWPRCWHRHGLDRFVASERPPLKRVLSSTPVPSLGSCTASTDPPPHLCRSSSARVDGIVAAYSRPVKLHSRGTFRCLPGCALRQARPSSLRGDVGVGASTSALGPVCTSTVPVAAGARGPEAHSRAASSVARLRRPIGPIAPVSRETPTLTLRYGAGAGTHDTGPNAALPLGAVVRPVQLPPTPGTAARCTMQRRAAPNNAVQPLPARLASPGRGAFSTWSGALLLVVLNVHVGRATRPTLTSQPAGVLSGPNCRPTWATTPAFHVKPPPRASVA